MFSNISISKQLFNIKTTIYQKPTPTLTMDNLLNNLTIQSTHKLLHITDTNRYTIELSQKNSELLVSITLSTTETTIEQTINLLKTYPPNTLIGFSRTTDILLETLNNMEDNYFDMIILDIQNPTPTEILLPIIKIKLKTHENIIQHQIQHQIQSQNQLQITTILYNTNLQTQTQNRTPTSPLTTSSLTTTSLQKQPTYLFRNTPIFIIAFNQYTYVNNMISQLSKYSSNIHIFDTGTTYKPLLDNYQKESNHPIWFANQKQQELGPHALLKDKKLYDLLPLFFIITDPDLLINEKIKPNFINEMKVISDATHSYKIGFAIDISEPDLFIDIKNYNGTGNTIISWEKHFWKYPTGYTSTGDKVYRSRLDTTFALYNKNYHNLEKDPVYDDAHHRIAGTYTCKHLPFYKTPLIPVPQEETDYYKQVSSKFSTVSKHT